MAVDPVGHLLGPGRMRERQARAAHDRHKQMGRPDLTGPAVHHHRHLVAGIIDEQLLPAAVLLAHHQRQPSFPSPKQIAVPAVPIAVRMLGDVFFP